MSGQRSVYSSCRPEVHDVLRRWRKLADGYDPHRVLDRRDVRARPDAARFVLRKRRRAQPRVQLHAACTRSSRAADLRTSIEQAERYLPDNAWPVWTGGNHDNHRFPSRWCGDDPAKTRAAMMMLMGLRGTPFLYYGDEIGMPDTDDPRRPSARPGRRVPRRTRRPRSRTHADAVDRRARAPVTPTRASSRGCRSATSPRATWPTSATIPTRCSRSPAISSACATRCPSSDAARTRRCASSDDRLWAWQRGDRTVVAMNCSDDAVDVPDAGTGTIRMSTIRARDDERVSGSLHLEPWEAAIVWRDA